MALFKFPYATGREYARQCAWLALADAAARTRQRDRAREKERGTRRRTLFEESLCEPSPPRGKEEIYGPALCTSGVCTYKRFLRDECLLLHTCILQVCESTCWNPVGFQSPFAHFEADSSTAPGSLSNIYIYMYIYIYIYVPVSIAVPVRPIVDGIETVSK